MIKKGKYEFKVRSYECGPDGRVTLANVCNYLQEAASINAEELGFSKSNFDSAGENISWVLTKLVVKMTRYPIWGEDVVIETFPRGGARLVAWRDFEIKNVAGESLGVATSEWMLINLTTRKIVTIPEAVLGCVDAENVPVLGTEPFARFKYPASDSTKDISFAALKAHIDLNGHVNNVHYVSWMLEPGETRCPSEMEMVFRSETFAGDQVMVANVEVDGYTYHRVYSPEGKDHIIARTRK